MPKSFPEVGVQIPEVLLPVAQVDPAKWAIIACDQFTSQPEYWNEVEELVGSAPSALNLIFPEVYLDVISSQDRIDRIHAAMKTYLEQNILQPHLGFIYVERTRGGNVRRGLIAALDLEQYDFRQGSQFLIRATEGTIVERIPARIQVRHEAVLEIPHTLVLIDDPENTVLGPLSQAKSRMKLLYDLELMMDSGHLTGWLVDQADLEKGIIQALRGLAQVDHFSNRYGLDPEQPVLLFAVGDGNHSFAAAKVLWDELKTQPGVSSDHPARYALVEIENLQDTALCFEPIHRVVFDLKVDIHSALKETFQQQVQFTKYAGNNAFDNMVRAVDRSADQGQAFGMVSSNGFELVRILNPASNLAVGTLQAFLDCLFEQNKAARIDYVHGLEVVYELGSRPGNFGFYLPPIDKTDLFKTVILDGALPRKTFSMGSARDKRFYMECRKIVP